MKPVILLLVKTALAAKPREEMEALCEAVSKRKSTYDRILLAGLAADIFDGLLCRRFLRPGLFVSSSLSLIELR